MKGFPAACLLATICFVASGCGSKSGPPGGGYVLKGASPTQRSPGAYPQAPAPGGLTPPSRGNYPAPAPRAAPLPPPRSYPSAASPLPGPPASTGEPATVYPPPASTGVPAPAYPPPAAGIGAPPAPGRTAPPPFPPALPQRAPGPGSSYPSATAPIVPNVPPVFAPISPALQQATRPLPANRPLGRKELALDGDNDGTVDSWFFIDEGRITRVSRDTDGDGKPDFTSSFTEDEGLPLTEVKYRGDTGQVATKTEFEAGVKTRREADDDGDGKPDHWWYYLGGDLSKEAWDRNTDGKIDEARHYRNGKIVRIEYDEDHDGTFEKNDYLKGGVRLRSEILDQDGMLTRVYDSQGTHVVRDERDADGDGIAEFVRVLSPSGAIEREDRDLDGDGWPDVSAYYTNGKLVRREVSGAYLRAQKSQDSAAPSVDVEKRDFRKPSGS